MLFLATVAFLLAKIVQLNAMEITVNIREKLLLVGHEAEMLLYF